MKLKAVPPLKRATFHGKLKTMKSIFSFLKKYWLFVFLAALAGSLIALKLALPSSPSPDSSVPTPPPSAPALAAPQIDGQALPSETDLSFNKTDLPTELPVFTGSLQAQDAARAQRIADNLGFGGEPEISQDVFLGTFLTWGRENRYLSINLETGRVDFSLDLYETEPGASGDLPAPPAAQENLKNLLTRLELWPGGEISWQKEVYLKQGFYFEPTDLKLADFIKVGFNPRFGDYQVVGTDPHEPLAAVILGRNEELIGLHFELPSGTFQEGPLYPLKSLENLKNGLQQEGRVVAYGTPAQSLDQPTLAKAELNEVRIAYYHEPNQAAIFQPIFIISGRGITEESRQEVEIDVYFPAIESVSLRNPQQRFDVEPPFNPLGL